MKTFLAFVVCLAFLACTSSDARYLKRVAEANEICKGLGPDWGEDTELEKGKDRCVRLILYFQDNHWRSKKITPCRFGGLPAFCAENGPEARWPMTIGLVDGTRIPTIDLSADQIVKAAIQKDLSGREACTLAGLPVFCKKSADGRLQVSHPNGTLMYDFSADEWQKADPRMLRIP